MGEGMREALQRCVFEFWHLIHVFICALVTLGFWSTDEQTHDSWLGRSLGLLSHGQKPVLAILSHAVPHNSFRVFCSIYSAQVEVATGPDLHPSRVSLAQ